MAPHPKCWSSLLPALAYAFALALAGSLLAQDDLRDVVTLRDNKEVRGRVVTPFAADELLVLQGGKRVRVARKEVKQLQLVGDQLREFLDRRRKQKDNPTLQWLLVEWAHAHGLDDMARLQALHLALPEPGLERAHLFLGHRRTDQGWLWPHGGRWLTFAQVQEGLTQTPLQLHGERFTVRCDGGLREAVDALFDLEHLGVWWFQEHGQALQLQEPLQPLAVELWRNSDTFPKWGFRPVPYYTPDPFGDVGRTFYGGADVARPRLLFFTGTQPLLYHALANGPKLQTDRDRLCPWLEVGLGMLAQGVLQGPPGFAAPGTWQHQDVAAMVALGRTYRLSQLLHLPMYGGFYLMDDAATATNWQAAATFVAYLLAEHTPATRGPFLQFVRQALGERKGDSSSLFDRLLGQRVEAFEAPLQQWLAQRAGR